MCAYTLYRELEYTFTNYVFSSSVIETFRTANSDYKPNIKALKRPAPIAYFYCYRSPADRARTDPEEILRALVKQICCSDADSPIIGPLASEYIEREENGEEDIKLTTDESVAVILKYLEIDPVTIIIDGLDECEPKEYRELIQALAKILNESASLVKIFLSSRNQQDQRFSLSSFPCFKISETDNGGDIQRYINWKLDEVIRNGDLLNGHNISNKIIEEIQDTLMEKSRGM